tara:strand:+ start:563 stop:817 length:255 start_codon:yes stop_codon:yes gene_type:complete
MKFFIKFLVFYFLVINSQANEGIKSKEEIERIIEEYLLENPEILIESLESYRNHQEARFEENKQAYIESYYKKKSMKIFLRQEI